MADGNEYYKGGGEGMVSTINTRWGGLPSLGQSGNSSNKMTFTQELEQGTSTWQGVWRRGIQKNGRSETEELQAIVLKGSTIYQTSVAMHRFLLL